MKICESCKQEKALDKFDRNYSRGKKFGYRKVCCQCRHKKYSKYGKRFKWSSASNEEIKDHIKKVITSNVSWNGDCLEWIGYKDKGGYGRMRYHKKLIHATRVLWFLEKNEFPEGKVICHKCDNPSCMNIDHLFSGTVQDNTVDAFKKDRRIGRRGERNNWVKLTEDQVKKIKIMLKENVSQSNIGKMFGVSRGAICDISRNINWKHID